MLKLITGATIIDGVSDKPIDGHAILIDGARVKALIPEADAVGLPGVERVDLSGSFVIPGLMDANVHLMGDIRPENLLRHLDRYEDLIVEAAQVALKGGLTTVFDTWGPRAHLIAVRDKVNRGEVVGSRIYCAGNIVGLDGPFSKDFFGSADLLSTAFGERLNAVFAGNVGPALSWMTPSEVAAEVAKYIASGIDFVKYAASEHRWGDPSTFLLFSERTQKAIVDITHDRGLTAQAHTVAVESLHVAALAGCDIIQHCNVTGRTPIPPETLALIAERQIGAVVMPFTEQRFKWIMDTCKVDAPYFAASDENCRNLIDAGARLLMCTDSMLFAPEIRSDPVWSNFWLAPGEDNLNDFGVGHFVWIKAMEEKGVPAMEVLRACTINIAKAYKKEADIGSIEPGKFADFVVLAKNPLEGSENYRTIRQVFKEGVAIDLNKLPERPIQTLPMPEPSSEQLAYRAHRAVGRSALPFCGCHAANH